MEEFVLTLIIEFSIKNYVYPEIFSSAQKISLKRLFDRCGNEIIVQTRLLAILQDCRQSCEIVKICENRAVGV